MKHARPVLIALAISLAALVAFPAGAAENAAPAKLDPKSPEARAVARWDYIIQGKPEKAYDLLSPGARSAKPKAVWAKEVAERPVRWQKVQFRDKACDSEEACLVRLEVTYTAPLQGAPGGMMTTPGFVTEHWVKVKRQWYFVPDDYVAGGLR